MAAAAEGPDALVAARALIVAVLARVRASAISPGSAPDDAAFADECKAEVAALHPAALAPFLQRNVSLAVLLTRAAKRVGPAVVEHCAEGFGGHGSTSLTMGALSAAAQAGGLTFATFNLAAGYRNGHWGIGLGGLLEWTEYVLADEKALSLALFHVLLALAAARGSSVVYLGSADGPTSMIGLTLPLFATEVAHALRGWPALQCTADGASVGNARRGILVRDRYYHPSGAGLVTGVPGKPSMPLQVVCDVALAANGGAPLPVRVRLAAGGGGAAVLPTLVKSMLAAAKDALSAQLAKLPPDKGAGGGAGAGGGGGAGGGAGGGGGALSAAQQKRLVLLQYVDNALDPVAALHVVSGRLAEADALIERGAVKLLLARAPGVSEIARRVRELPTSCVQPNVGLVAGDMTFGIFTNVTLEMCPSVDDFLAHTRAAKGAPREPTRLHTKPLEVQLDQGAVGLIYQHQLMRLKGRTLPHNL